MSSYADGGVFNIDQTSYTVDFTLTNVNFVQPKSTNGNGGVFSIKGTDVTIIGTSLIFNQAQA